MILRLTLGSPRATQCGVRFQLHSAPQGYSFCHQCSGHPCIQGQRQQEEEAQQEAPPVQEEAAAVKVMVKVDIQAHQEEEDHLHQEEAKEEAQCRGKPHHSHQEEEQAIQDLLHLYLQVFNNLHVHQIHGVHLIDRGKPFQS